MAELRHFLLDIPRPAMDREGMAVASGACSRLSAWWVASRSCPDSGPLCGHRRGVDCVLNSSSSFFGCHRARWCDRPSDEPPFSCTTPFTGIFALVYLVDLPPEFAGR